MPVPRPAVPVAVEPVGDADCPEVGRVNDHFPGRVLLLVRACFRQRHGPAADDPARHPDQDAFVGVLLGGWLLLVEGFGADEGIAHGLQHTEAVITIPAPMRAPEQLFAPFTSPEAVTYCVFDLLVHGGRLTMNLPLVERKALLEGLVAGVPGILFVKDLDADAAVFQAMVQAGLQIEGVVAKRRDSRYHPGVRSDDWRKIKRQGWQDGRTWRG